MIKKSFDFVFYHGLLLVNLRKSVHMDYKNVKVIAFDADDTLWINETYFRDSEIELSGILKEYGDENFITEELFAIEMRNISYYGFGIKGFTISMIETAIKVSNGKIDAEKIQQIIDLSKQMIEKPVELLDDVKETIEWFGKQNYKMVVATKGDLLDQQRKLKKSNLEQYFHHIEVMTDKKEEDYESLLRHLEIDARDFLMIGNSLKSDIIPVLELGGNAIHIPFHTTWQHEVVEDYSHPQLKTLNNIKELIRLFS